MRIVIVVCAACAIMMVLIANLLLKPQATKKFFIIAGGAANFLGFFLYGYGYATHQQESTIVAILKTLFAVFGMFLGKDGFDDMSKLAFFDLLPVKFFFYMAHILALYVTASAAMTAFGAGLINRVRALTLRRGDLNIFPFVNNHTLYLGNELCSQGKKVLFICKKNTTSEVIAKIQEMRAVYTSSDAASSASEFFLKSIALARMDRQVTVYALGDSVSDNITYARGFRKSMENLKIPAAGTRLILGANEYFDISSLMNNNSHYGFENVHVFDDTALAARIMIADCPPYKTLSFDENARTTDDFNVMIVGFGSMGQAVLRALLMNGQFYGSHFSAIIFDPAESSQSGAFKIMYSEMLERYDISFVGKDGRSDEAFDYLHRHAAELNYVVIATGGQTDSELEFSYANILHTVHPEAYLVSCRSSEVTEIRTEVDGIVRKSWPLYNLAIVSGEELDKDAMDLNHQYCGNNGKTVEENWFACDYFSRLSSEASADFVPAFLYMAGTTRDEVLKHGLNLTEKQEEALCRTEHMRWCAFHFAHRYRTMTPEEWNERAAVYTHEKTEKGFSSIKIGKNRVGRTHACLIPWEELVELDDREKAVTGVDPDYQERDRHTIQLIPKLIV